MKRLILPLTLLLLCFAVAGCTPSTPPDLTGLVYVVEENRILVIEGLDDLGTPFEEWSEQGLQAVYFSVTDKTVIEKEGKKISFADLRAGQIVQAWSTGVYRDSYPAQSEAKKIVVLTE